MPVLLKGYAKLLSDDDSGSALLVDGEDVIAHVHAPEYVPLFAHAEEMLTLLTRFATHKCDKLGRLHSPSCRACAASALLSAMQDSDAGSTLH